MKYPFATMTALGLLVSSATAAYASNSHVESALAGQGELSVFYQALLNTGVANELNENTEYTVFAPTNAAFTEIQPKNYPCFYSMQCRADVAAILRNHIVPRNETISRFAKWGGEIPTIGKNRLDVEEPFKDEYTVDGHRVLYLDESNSKFSGNEVSLYKIDGVIASDQELNAFHGQPYAGMPGTITQKTVTTYRTPVMYQSNDAAVSDGHMIPGGYSGISTTNTAPNESWDPDDDIETTTVTHTTVTQ